MYLRVLHRHSRRLRCETEQQLVVFVKGRRPGLTRRLEHPERRAVRADHRHAEQRLALFNDSTASIRLLLLLLLLLLLFFCGMVPRSA